MIPQQENYGTHTFARHFSNLQMNTQVKRVLGLTTHFPESITVIESMEIFVNTHGIWRGTWQSQLRGRIIHSQTVGEWSEVEDIITSQGCRTSFKLNL